MPRRRRSTAVSIGEVLVWFLFVALLVPAGVVGWAIGHSTAGGTRTVTVRAAGAAPTTTRSAPATTASATTAAATTTAAPSTTTAPAAAAGDAAKGKAVFTSAGCGSCHAFKPAGTSATVGPDLDTRPAQDAKKANMQLAAFVHESIVSPDAFIASGYAKGIMPTTFGSTLSKQQVDDLVAFVVSGSS